MKGGEIAVVKELSFIEDYLRELYNIMGYLVEHFSCYGWRVSQERAECYQLGFVVTSYPLHNPTTPAYQSIVQKNANAAL